LVIFNVFVSFFVFLLQLIVVQLRSDASANCIVGNVIRSLELLELVAQGAYNSGKPGNLREFVNSENSGN